MSASCYGPPPAWVFKRGASFVARCTYAPVEGAVPSLVGAAITSHIRRAGDLVQELVCQLAADSMSFDLLADESDTAGWPATTLAWDIRIELDGDVIYTETLSLRVIDAVTLAADGALP